MDNQTFVLSRLCTPGRIVSRPGVSLSMLSGHARNAPQMIGSASDGALPTVRSSSGWAQDASSEFRARFKRSHTPPVTGRLCDLFKRAEATKGGRFSLTTAMDRKGPFTSAQLHYRLPDRVFVDRFAPHTKVGMPHDRETEYRESVYTQWNSTGIKEPNCFRP